MGKKAKLRKKKRVKKKVAEAPKLVKLDLACGESKREGFEGVDIVKLPTVEVVHDLNIYPWPWKDNSVDEIHCSHFIEHVDDAIKFLNEVYRILKPKSQATIIAPYYSSMRAWQDPTHKRAISEAFFLYFNKGWRVAQKLEHYGIKADFDFTYGYALNPLWATKNEEARNYGIMHYINVVQDVIVTLTKREIGA